MNKYISMQSLLLICVLCFGSNNISSASEQEEEKILQSTSQPNIILVTINSLRADHVGIYGYKRNTTPNFDKFAEENTLYNHAFATSSWQMPSHGSILTSLYPSEHRAVHINNKLAETCKTLPEILSERGYYSAGFCCNPRLDSKRGFARGFDFYDDYSVDIFLSNLAMSNDEKFDINQQRTNDLINRSAIRWLKNNKSKPFFMFIHYYDNHWDYLPPEPYYSMFDSEYKGKIDGKLISKEPLYSNPPSQDDIDHILALYDAEVRQTDEDLGFFLQHLDVAGLIDNSVIIIAGEHGEQFYEHGNTSHHGLYDELIHVPLAIHFPKTKSSRQSGLVSLVDILPTVFDVVGLNDRIPKSAKGISLLRSDGKEKHRDWIFAEYTGGAIPDSYAIRSENYKILQSDGQIKIFDLIKDPQEYWPLREADYNKHIESLKKTFDEIKGNLGVKTTEPEKAAMNS